MMLLTLLLFQISTPSYAKTPDPAQFYPKMCKEMKDPTSNSYCRDRMRERELILKLPKVLRRPSEGVVEIRLLKNKTKKYEDEESQSYSVIDYDKKRGFATIAVQYHEGGSTLMFDLKSGKK